MINISLPKQYNDSIPQQQTLQQPLIITSFIENSQPLIQLEIKLNSNFILIKSNLSNHQNDQKKILLDQQLTYRIFITKQSSSQNYVWFLYLQTSSTKYSFKSEQIHCASVWDSFLKRKLCKFGFWDDFRPVRRISKGFSSAVYQVSRKLDNKRFAVKVFPKTILDSNPNIKKGVDCEISMLRAIKQLNHINLLGLQQAYFSDSSLYLVIQLCGKDLINGFNISKAVSSQQKLKLVMKQLLEGLVILHDKNIIHRDLKPGNIMFRLNKQLQLVITDFGLTVMVNNYHPFLRSGTPGFIAPQIFKLKQNQKLTNCASDMFSMGAIFHLLLTGNYLFEGQSRKQVLTKNQKMEFDLTHSRYNNLNKLALNLLEKMLNKCEIQRITARQALDHQYLDIKSQFSVSTFQTGKNFIIQNEQQQSSLVNMGRIGLKKIKEQNQLSQL